MWSKIVVTDDVSLLFATGCLLLGAFCLLICSLYNFYFFRKHKDDFYQMFKGQEWIKGASYDHLDFRGTVSFILSYMMWKCSLKLKKKKIPPPKIDMSAPISISCYIKIKDIMRFERQHPQWLKINIFIQSISLGSGLWLIVYVFLFLD